MEIRLEDRMSSGHGWFWMSGWEVWYLFLGNEKNLKDFRCIKCIIESWLSEVDSGRNLFIEYLKTMQFI